MPGDVTSTDRARLRWRARRGLLENDLIIQRFLDACEAELTAADVQALMRLFEKDDTELFDLLLGRSELSGPDDDPHMQALLKRMKTL